MISSNFDYEKIFCCCTLGSLSIGSGTVLLSRIDSVRSGLWKNVACASFLSYLAFGAAYCIAKNGALNTLEDMIKEYARHKIGKAVIP